MGPAPDLFANPAALVQTGCAVPGVLGRSPRLFQCDAADPQAGRGLREAMRHWQPVRPKILNQPRDGRRFGVEIAGADRRCPWLDLPRSVGGVRG